MTLGPSWKLAPPPVIENDVLGHALSGEGLGQIELGCEARCVQCDFKPTAAGERPVDDGGDVDTLVTLTHGSTPEHRRR